MKPVTVEIYGTDTLNRGAELMAIAIADRLRRTFPGVRLAVSARFGALPEIHGHGFAVTLENQSRIAGRIRTWLARRLLRYRKGIIDPAEVDVVLDASGFALSDQWGPAPPRKLARIMKRSYRCKQTLVLLPQAMGPFRKPEVVEACHRLFALATLVCARDNQSMDHVEELGDFPGLRKYPDFTVGVAPLLPRGLDLPQQFCAIVPNYRMLDKTGSGHTYLEFLAHAVKIVRARRLNPAFVVHDSKEDHEVVEEIRNRSGDIRVLTHADPRVLKGILGKADFVIGSRFHALVSALSQGVPCICAGWSHKYPELLRDFSCPELLVVDLTDFALLEAAIDGLADRERRALVSHRLLQAADTLKSQTETMWEEIEAVIRGAVSRPAPE